MHSQRARIAARKPALLVQLVAALAVLAGGVTTVAIRSSSTPDGPVRWAHDVRDAIAATEARPFDLRIAEYARGNPTPFITNQQVDAKTSEIRIITPQYTRLLLPDHTYTEMTDAEFSWALARLVDPQARWTESEGLGRLSPGLNLRIPTDMTAALNRKLPPIGRRGDAYTMSFTYGPEHQRDTYAITLRDGRLDTVEDLQPYEKGKDVVYRTVVRYTPVGHPVDTAAPDPAAVLDNDEVNAEGDQIDKASPAAFCVSLLAYLHQRPDVRCRNGQVFVGGIHSAPLSYRSATTFLRSLRQQARKALTAQQSQ